METVGPIIPALVLAAIVLSVEIDCGVSINAESTAEAAALYDTHC